MKAHDWLILTTHHLHVHLMVLGNLSIVIDVLLFHQLLLLLLGNLLLFLLVQLFVMLLKIVTSCCNLTGMGR